MSDAEGSGYYTTCWNFSELRLATQNRLEVHLDHLSPTFDEIVEVFE